MDGFSCLLIVAATLTATTDTPFPDAQEVFHCQFDQPWDNDFDRWPDRWTRLRGKKFPWYLPVEIQSDEAASWKRCVTIKLDGGAATVYSPPINVNRQSSYVLSGKIKTEGLKHNRAYFSVTFLDDQGNALESFPSPSVVDAPQWKPIRMGPFASTHPQVRTAIIGLNLHPGETQDLQGQARFDDIWLGELPRLEITTNRPFNLYADPKDVKVSCQIRGALRPNTEVYFQLRDGLNRVVAEMTRAFEGKAGSNDLEEDTSSNSDQAVHIPTEPLDEAQVIEWAPGNIDFGFYRALVTLRTRHGKVHEQSTTLAVLRPESRSMNGQFGWSLAAGGEILSLDDLAHLLPSASVNWLKYPLWYDASQDARGDELLKFAQQLSHDRIEMVGLLDKPPRRVAKQFGPADTLTAATIFAADPSKWFPALDPIMTHLSLKIRWWQLGGDHDTSFVGFPDLADRLSTVKDQLFRLGQHAHLGLGWRWTIETPRDESAPWSFINFSASPPLTGDELATYLAANQTDTQQRWVLIEPLPASEYSLVARIQNLFLQMLSAVLGSADAIFLSDPFSTHHDVVHSDGTPGPLFVPWRTTATLLRDSTYVGQIQLPEGSHNHIFNRDHDTLMVVWNDRPVDEVIYLGEDVNQVDIWGKQMRPRIRGGKQIVQVGRLPIFLTGINRPIARWRMEMALDETQLPSVFGPAHENAITLRNSFPRGVNGEMRIILPRQWRAVPRRSFVKLAPNTEQRLPFEVTLPLGASSGVQPLQVDFDITADRRYRFSAYRQLETGLGDMEIHVVTRIDEEGTLLVEQRTVNHSDEAISFRFYLQAPGRRRQRSHISELGRGEDTRIYRFDSGRSLAGQTLWLRAEEIDGLRIFNRRFMADE